MRITEIPIPRDEEDLFDRGASKTLLKKEKRNWSMKAFWFGSISSYRLVGGKEGRRSPPIMMISDEEKKESARSSW